MAHGAHRRRIDLRGTALLFAITVGGFSVILLLRAELLNVGLGGHSPVLLRCIHMLDLAAALILPMVSGFTLVMLPYVSLRGMRRAAKLLAGGCLLALSLLAVTTRVSAVHAAPQGTTNPIDRPRPQGRSFALPASTGGATSFPRARVSRSWWELKEVSAARS